MSAGTSSKLGQLAISYSLTNDLRHLEDARLGWIKQLQPYLKASEEARRISTATHSALSADHLAALHNAKQFLDQHEHIKRMLDPIADIRKQYALDPSLQQLINNAKKPARLDSELTRILAASSQITQLMQPFRDAHKYWEIPKELAESVSALKVLQESIGRLTMPVIDWSSAATLAKLLGDDGIEAQLVALGIQANGTLLEESEYSAGHENGIGLNRKALELMALLSFIAAFLIPYLQERSSNEWQGKTDSELTAHRQLLEQQEQQLEALSKLVLIAIERESKKEDVRMVVLDRMTTVRAYPENGSEIVSKLFPREVVKPFSQQGKWIQIEYYDWLRQQNYRGWALKKYFKRVPTNYMHRDLQEDAELRQIAEARLNDGQPAVKVNLNDL